MFKRIVVGTDGSETASEAVRQAIDLAKLSGATLSIVSAYAPVSKGRVGAEQADAPADVQYEIGPREDVNLVLEKASPTPRARASRRSPTRSRRTPPRASSRSPSRPTPT